MHTAVLFCRVRSALRARRWILMDGTCQQLLSRRVKEAVCTAYEQGARKVSAHAHPRLRAVCACLWAAGCALTFSDSVATTPFFSSKALMASLMLMPLAIVTAETLERAAAPAACWASPQGLLLPCPSLPHCKER